MSGFRRFPPGFRWGLAAFLGLLAWALWEYVRLPEAESLKTRNPKVTALMEQREQEAAQAGKAFRRRQKWVSLAAISPWVQHAVLLSEDASFFQHEGIDFVELQNAFEEAWEDGELGRGASTLTQQLAKNLWLSTDRSLLRKAKEWILARRLEEALTKKRILALYLNVVEWGPGVFGIEAAALEHFGISAANVSAAQAALLAAMLPAPRKRTLSSGSPALRKRAHWVVDHYVLTGRMSPEAAKDAHAEVDRALP